MCALCQQLGIDLHKLDAGVIDGAADGASASWAALPGNPGADAESSGSDTVPGSTGSSSTLSGGTSVRGFINGSGDQDWYAVTLTAGQAYTFALSGFGVGALSDAYLRLLNSSGTQVAFDDDSGPLANSRLTFTASASGTYYVSAQGYGTTTGQYLLTMATGTTPYAPVVTVSDVADYLTNTYWEVNGSIAHHWGVSTISYNVQGLSAPRADLARLAFQLWSEVANLTFVETTGTGQITLDDTQSGAFSSSNYGSNGIITSATVNVEPTWYGSSSAIDSYTLQTFIHEIGHSLGLGHAGAYNGSATYGVDNIYANDTWQYTLMSYMAESNFGGASYRFTMTPMMADILAIQNLYGAPTTRTDDTVYGFGSTAGSMYNFSTYSTAPSLTIYDSGGTDTLNASGYSQNQVINLAGGSFSNIGGLVGNVGIYTTSVIENAIGGSGNDTITGNSVANVLTGGGGADTLNGLAGDDTLDGGTGNDTMVGGTGNDIYYVDSLSDVVTENSGEGTDTVYASINGYTLAANIEIGRVALTTGATLTGNALDNTLYGNSGNDTLDGGAGTDTVVYSGLASNYQLVHNANGTWTITDLRTGSPDGTDTLTNIEQVQFSDTLVSLNTVLSTPTISSFSNDSGTVGDGITNDNTLTLTGSAAAGNTVSVYDGATLLGTAVADGAGTWTFTTGALADATHSLSAIASDGLGHISATSSVLAVTVDTTAPGAPTIASFSTDSGTVGDFITNDNTLALSGTAAAGSTVSVYDGATLLGTATANGSGAWTFTTGALADATHSFTATARDAAGNTGAASSVLAVTVDTAAPSAPTISSYSTDSGTVGDGITNDNTLTFTGTAAAGATVSLYDGATLLGTATANGSGAWTFATGVLTDAAHSFTATASDAAGNVSVASSALSVTVDTVAPGAPTISSYSTDSGTVGDGITNDNTLTFTGTAAAGATVSVYDGATLLGTATANGSGAWTFTTGTLTDAAHSFTATAGDAAGNTSAASSVLAVTVDTAAPGAPTISSYSTDSGTVGDGITNDNTLTFTGTAAAGATVSVYDGATLLGTATANGSGAWTFTTGTLTDAAHSFTATARDAAGNTGAASSVLAVTVDTTAPSAPVISSYSTDSGTVGDGITNDNTLTFTGTAAAGATVSLYDGATPLGTATANGSGAWTFATGVLTDAAHSFTATAGDAAGNVSAASSALSVTVDTVAPGAPTISSYSTDSGTVGDGITNDNTLTFTGTAAAGATVSVYDGATLLGTATASGSGAWTFTTGTLSDATHSFTATAGDAAGNVSAASSALSVTVDTVAPGAPTISSYSTDSGTVGDGITNDNTLTFTGTAAAGATVSVYDGATLLGTATANGSGAWTFTTGTLTDAAHSFTATTSDAAGNVSAASSPLSVTVDTVAPGAPTISSYSTDSGTVGDGITNDNTLTFTGSAAAGATVSVYDGATLLGTATANGSGAWTFTTGTLADAAHSFAATARDVAGNVSVASTALNVTIDTLASGAPIISSYSTDSGAVGDGITNDNTLTFTGTAAAGATVTVYDGATLLGTATANGSGAWTFTTGTLTDAAHSFTATASDVAGNVSAASSPLSVTVDTVAPNAPAISSYSADSGTIGDGITNDNTLTLTGTAAAGSTVSIYDGATLLGAAGANGSGAWTFTTGALVDATHSFTARASDAAGNTSATSSALNVTIDTAAPGAPTIAAFSTDSGAVGDNITNDNTLTLTGTAVAGSTVSLYDGATLLGTSTANGGGAWSFTTGTLSDATHSLTATATDTAGNASAVSAALMVTVDTLAPGAPTIASFSTDSGAAGDNITNDSTLTLTGAAAAGSTVSIYDGATFLGSATANGTGAWSFDTGTLADAVHSLTARASDAAGNVSAASAALQLTIDTAGPAAPTIGDSTVNSFGSSGASLTLTGTAEAGSSVSVYGMDMVKGGGATFLGTATAALDGTWSFATGTLSGTALRFTATASDTAGNASSGSALFNVMVIDSSPTGGSADVLQGDTGWSKIGESEPASDVPLVNVDELHQVSPVPHGVFLLP